ncbi:MAG: hypothetical protein WD690_06330 [Vicinamibacterales bacterium]
MQPPNEFNGGGFRGLSLLAQSIHFRLHAHVRGGFHLEVSSSFLRIELSCERALNIARPRVVTFDEIAVVRVHQTDECRQVRGGQRMQGTAERGRRSR